MCVFKHVLTKVVKLQVAIFHHKSCVDHQASCKEIWDFLDGGRRGHVGQQHLKRTAQVLRAGAIGYPPVTNVTFFAMENGNKLPIYIHL